jgi:hypothetical protein
VETSEQPQEEDPELLSTSLPGKGQGGRWCREEVILRVPRSEVGEAIPEDATF